MDDYNLIKATEEDGIEMLELIESMPSKGKLELLYTRRPNAYTSYMYEKKDADVYLVRDEENKIAFQASSVVHNYYFENKVIPIGYIGGLRKNPNFKGNLHWTNLLYKLDKEVLKYHDFYCSILNDNNHAKKVLTKKRENWPNFDIVCEYTTNIFNSNAVNDKKWDNDYKLEKINKSNIKKVYEFINREGSKYNFFPQIKDLKDFPDINIDECYILTNNNEIVAFTTQWNQTNFKQYIVKKYHFPLNILSSLNFITNKLGYISFPKEDGTFEFNHLSFLLVKDNDIEIYKSFIYKICQKEKNKSFVIGINDNDIQREIYDKIKKISFKSTIYYIYFGKNKKLHNKPYIECALL